MDVSLEEKLEFVDAGGLELGVDGETWVDIDVVDAFDD